MKVALAIPFRAGKDATRDFAYQKTLEHLLELFPWHHVSTFDSPKDKPFSRTIARNMAVRANRYVDIIVICDADSIPEAEPLRKAIHGAYKDRRCHFPFDKVHGLTKSSTRKVSRRPLHTLQTYQVYGPSQGGCWVISPETWWKAGGMDERLVGWGFEDRVFIITSNALVGTALLHPGSLYCLWHTRAASIVLDTGDSQLFNEYNAIKDNHEAVRDLVTRRGSYEWVNSEK